jgi:hypothetical protein
MTEFADEVKAGIKGGVRKRPIINSTNARQPSGPNHICGRLHLVQHARDSSTTGTSGPRLSHARDPVPKNRPKNSI